jgi:hypothetical protein
MGFQYGIGRCEETLLRLSRTDLPLEERLRNAWSEIDVIEYDDGTPDYYNAIKQWKERYLSKAQFSISVEGRIESGEPTEMGLLSSDLERLCIDIIDKNTSETEAEDK